ncbi:hypothetical protein PVBG_05620 [Plasmodium vivax Brazil I]|uniref:Variable surface protein Vir35 n=1 Tax=Plasmodium vivax (strain Brazil I) TaxID=1033975 RepID=A0A0J9T141_PLAV1|nr:hypothetical protein PVBG_05620 [Plasmodium vivax Brazil I]
MAIIKSNHMNHNTKYIFFTKIVTFLILSWIYQCTKHENELSSSLENGNKVNISVDIRTHRLLAKHEYQNEMPTRGLQNKVSYNKDNYKLEKGTRNNNTFQQLKQSGTNYVDDYLKSYKKRYSKKRGLKKLDCYYEKVLFGSFNKLKKHVEHKNSSKSKILSIICSKYGLPLILLSLLPLIALKIPEVLIKKVHGDDFSKCKYTNTGSPNEFKAQKLSHDICPKVDIKDPYLKYIYVFILIFITFALIIYTYIKILKYNRIYAGMLK